MIEAMGILRVTEVELASDIGTILNRVQSGTEVIVERNARPVAVLRAVEPHRRRLSEILGSLSEDSTATIDPEFAADVQAVIDSHREPLNSPDWD